MKTKKLFINTKSEKYPIIIGKNLLLKISNILKDSSVSFTKCLLVVDKNVPIKTVTELKKNAVILLDEPNTITTAHLKKRQTI